MYTCGVTVYDDCHIGHARSLYIFEVIRRYLEYRGFNVKFVRNITDIDDKIIDKARMWSSERKIPIEEAFNLVRETYIKSYYQDLKALNIPPADEEPKATDIENIEAMDDFVHELIEKGYAYESSGDAYFSIKQFKDYGKLSGQSLDKMRVGVRKEPGDKKKDPLDFVLWKKKKDSEPSWESGISEGRPGWHIECSAMAQKYLGETLDIHGGGKDLIFPHHENEIAQSEALTGKMFAKYWIHHGLLTINAQKMAKSLGNFVTIKDFVKKYHDAGLLKLFFLSTHYSNPIDFTWKKMEGIRQTLERIMILIEKIERKLSVVSCQLSDKKIDEIENIKNKFIEAMDDDFNTPRGLVSVFELVNIANKNINDLDFIFEAENLLFELTEIFGLDLKKIKTGSKNLPARVTVLIKKRNEARQKGDFEKADEIRKDLEQVGVVLEDTKEGTVWRRKL